MSSLRTADLCPNCSIPLSGAYCAHCGQHQVDLERPLRELIAQGLSAVLAFDTPLVRTLWPLVRQPGFVTTEFLVGRRARYVHPFKLYFAFSPVPVFAGLLQLLYRKPRYVAHLVFALHLHSFGFLVLIIGAVLDGALAITATPGAGTGNTAATLAIVVYTFFALRRVYRQGRMVTGAKQFMLILGYAVALASTLLATLVFTAARL